MKNNVLFGEKNFPVYEFCKENNIDCTWDLDDDTTWTEIYFNDVEIFQFEWFTTVEQFIGVMNHFHNGTNLDDICGIVGGKDFFWSFENEPLCKEFIEHNAGIFAISQ